MPRVCAFSRKIYPGVRSHPRLVDRNAKRSCYRQEHLLQRANSSPRQIIVDRSTCSAGCFYKTGMGVVNGHSLPVEVEYFLKLLQQLCIVNNHEDSLVCTVYEDGAYKLSF